MKGLAAVARSMDPKADLLRNWPLTGGVSAQVHGLEIARPGAGPQRIVQRIVVRCLDSESWKDRSEEVAGTEFHLMEALRGMGFPVPEPLLLDTSCRLLPTPFLVMSWVEGTTTIEEDDLPGALPKLAELLANLHGLDQTNLDVPTLQPREDPIQGALDYLPTNLRSSPVSDAIRCHELKPNPDCLLHGDFWPGNVLWQGTQPAAVIDWEDAAIGCPLSDLACCRAELNAIFGATAMERFTKSYLSCRSLEVLDLPLWDFYVGAAALATMHEWGLPAEAERTRRERTTTFVELAARELVARATESSDPPR